MGQTERQAWTGQTGQVRQEREDGMRGHDLKDRTVGTGELGTRMMEQNILERTGGTGQDSQKRQSESG
jgi:hypothetical protein